MASDSTADDVTWAPTQQQQRDTRMWNYMMWLRKHRHVVVDDYRELWHWSTNEPSDFWDSIREYFDVIGEGFDGPALAVERMPGAVWYPNARVNFAENLLRYSLDPAMAETLALKETLEDGPGRAFTWSDLASQVASLASRLRRLGIVEGDRVAAVLPNVPEALIGLLATASIGAIWTISSPDLSEKATLDRLRQLEPKVLIGSCGYRFNGSDFDRREHLATVEAGLPTLLSTIVVRAVDYSGEGSTGTSRLVFEDLITDDVEAEYARVPFDHPLWVLFSSGTTGTPKGIVHGHGGMLLEALKVSGLNFDLGIGDVYYVAANTSWMVWNLLVASMTVGSAGVTYSGSPTSRRKDRQFQIIADCGVTMFGTGAAYLQLVQTSGARPGKDLDLTSLRSILSTGSALPDSTWQWVHDSVKHDVHLGSDSGGTDICSAFVGSNPLEPVHRGWLQGPMLGVAAEVWDESGKRVVGDVGEMVITRPMPSMPIRMWADDGSRYRSSYFETFPGTWTQGDWAVESDTGMFQLHGRSDATLNRAGVRLGSAEIYSALVAIAEIRDSLVIGVELPEGGYYMPLFVALSENTELDETLRQRIRQVIRDGASARHVPDEILQAPAIPVTHAQKKIEIPIKKLFLGQLPERVINRGSLSNPDAVDWFVHRAAEFRASGAAAQPPTAN